MIRTPFLLAAAALLAGAVSLPAQTPDRAPRAEEWGYRPAEGDTVAVNPPAFSWVSDGKQYHFDLEWSSSADFTAPTRISDLKWSVYTHHHALTPGRYWWRYRILPPSGAASAWSKARTFTVPASAIDFPQPTMEEIRTRIPTSHPRLFVTANDLPRLRQWTEREGRAAFAALRARGDALLKGDPTPEPTVMGTIGNPATVDYWWANRVQTMKACQEAETLSFLFLMTGELKYRDGAHRWVMHLAAWNPDGPTNFRLNDEAAMPILHRLARAYDWGYDALSDEERMRVRTVLARRALDVWKSGQAGEGAGHLNSPYSSHANRSWHKLAENAVATFGENPESDRYIEFALTKFFAAYPVWSDDDGGWHEGMSYWAGYMTKIRWWIDLARSAFGIDAFRKPFFAHFADYAMYTAPPGSPDGGFGDLSSRPPSQGWSFVHYFAAAAKNPYWAWWAREWKIASDRDEPVLGLLWSTLPRVEPKAPSDLPPSRLFAGIGVAIMNSSLVDPAHNVQVRFKSSPFGRQSHGHDAHNSFTLNAYGEALLVNNVYRDIYGSPFHKDWCWSTVAQNALLVNHQGQRSHNAAPDGKIVKFESNERFDYVVGDATAAYEGKLKLYRRHVMFAHPDVVVIADEVEAATPSTFQLMLHAQQAFTLDEAGQRATLDRTRAGVLVDYSAASPLTLKQTTGYTPEPNWKYLKDVSKSSIPPQWHMEASTVKPATRTWLVTVLRPYAAGKKPSDTVKVERSETGVVINAAGRTIRIAADGANLR